MKQKNLKKTGRLNFEFSFNSYLEKAFLKAPLPAQKLLRKSLFYSLKAKASRFRPGLCFATTELLGEDPKKILPWAIALEMAHTASLIHDDMPCMDDATNRRDQKCNHLVFGEDIALLAGACLFVESFSLLKAPGFDKKRTDLLELLVSALGFHGLMSGQALDLKSQSPEKTELLKTMRLKTGVLISACILGPALLWANPKEYKALKIFAKRLGLAYQLADDYEDLFQDSNKLKKKNKPEASNQKTRQSSKQIKKPKTLKNSKKNWLYKEGHSQLEKSKKSLSLFQKDTKNLHSLIKEIERKFKK